MIEVCNERNSLKFVSLGRQWPNMCSKMCIFCGFGKYNSHITSHGTFLVNFCEQVHPTLSTTAGIPLSFGTTFIDWKKFELYNYWTVHPVCSFYNWNTSYFMILCIWVYQEIYPETLFVEFNYDVVSEFVFSTYFCCSLKFL